MAGGIEEEVAALWLLPIPPCVEMARISSGEPIAHFTWLKNRAEIASSLRLMANNIDKTEKIDLPRENAL